MTEEILQRGKDLLNKIETQKRKKDNFDKGTSCLARPLLIGFMAGNNFVKVRETTSEETQTEYIKIIDDLEKFEKEFEEL